MYKCVLVIFLLKGSHEYLFLEIRASFYETFGRNIFYRNTLDLFVIPFAFCKLETCL